MSLTASIAVSILALSGAAFAAPTSQNGLTAAKRDAVMCDCSDFKSIDDPVFNFCYYGDTITLDEYLAYVRANYDTGNMILYTGESVDQVTNFQGAGNSGYYYYNDLFATDSAEQQNSHKYINYFPTMTASNEGAANGATCYRPDDADASSMAISMVASGTVLVFGGIEYKNYPGSYFSSKEIKNLLTNLGNGQLSTIAHMVNGAVTPTDVLATEDASETFHFTDGHSDTETNASGPSGDCSTTQDEPTCDRPSNDSNIHVPSDEDSD